MSIQLQPHQKYDHKNFDRLGIAEPWSVPLCELAPRLCGHRYHNDAVSQLRSFSLNPGEPDPRDTSPTWYHRNPKDWHDYDYSVTLGSLCSAVEQTLFVHREFINVVPLIPVQSSDVNLSEAMFGRVASEEPKERRPLERALHDNDLLGSPLAKLQDRVADVIKNKGSSQVAPVGFEHEGILALRNAGDLVVVFAHLSLLGRRDPIWLREYSNSGKRIKRLADAILNLSPEAAVD